ncbi:unnamed protein product [Lampetra fluviatilis]
MPRQAGWAPVRSHGMRSLAWIATNGDAFRQKTLRYSNSGIVSPGSVGSVGSPGSVGSLGSVGSSLSPTARHHGQEAASSQELLLGREMREPLPLARPPRPHARPAPHPSSSESEAASASELELWPDQGEPNPAAEPGETQAPRGTRPQC